jgi:hypothetical protein
MQPRSKSFDFPFFILQALVILLIYLNFMVWVQKYDFGDNLDDKLVSAISSKFFFNKSDGQHIFEQLIDKCGTSNKVSLCEARYTYRADTLSNYLLPSLSIRFFEFFFTKTSESEDFSKALSLAFFYGYAFIFLLVCFISVFFVNYLNNKTSRLLMLLSFISLTISNPQVFELSSFSSVFLNVTDTNFHPTVYAPRGAVSILLLPISLAILFYKPKSLILLLLLASLIHTGYAQIFALVSLIAVSAITFIQDMKYLRLVLLLILYNACLLVFIYIQLSFSGEAIMGVNFENLSLVKIFKGMNFEIVLFYLFGALILVSKRPGIIKRAIIILFTFHIFLLSLHLLSTAGVLNYTLSGSDISDRMNGCFVYIVFAFAIFIVGAEIRRSAISKEKYTYILLFLLGIFLYININVNYVYSSINRIFNYQFISEQINRVSDSHVRLQMVKNDIQLFIDKNFQVDGNQYWLTEKNGSLEADMQKIKRMTFLQIDVKNEFQTFLYLYKASNF